MYEGGVRRVLGSVLRKEVIIRVRIEVLKVRRSLGYKDKDPEEGLVETWIEEERRCREDAGLQLGR
jgi:hypothetical protein